MPPELSGQQLGSVRERIEPGAVAALCFACLSLGWSWNQPGVQQSHLSVELRHEVELKLGSSLSKKRRC